MRMFLTCLRMLYSQSAAARKAGVPVKTVVSWIKCSKNGRPGYEVNWRGVTLPIHEHCEIAKDEFTDALENAALEWTRERLIYKIDPIAESLGFEGV